MFLFDLEGLKTIFSYGEKLKVTYHVLLISFSTMLINSADYYKLVTEERNIDAGRKLLEETLSVLRAIPRCQIRARCLAGFLTDPDFDEALGLMGFAMQCDQSVELSADAQNITVRHSMLNKLNGLEGSRSGLPQGALRERFSQAFKKALLIVDASVLEGQYEELREL